MVDKRNPIQKKTFLPLVAVNCLALKPAIASTEHADDGPCGQNDRTGGNFDKGYVEAELDINPDLGSSDATSLAIRLCQDAWAWTNVAAGRVLPRLAGRRR